jgi:lysozyme
MFSFLRKMKLKQIVPVTAVAVALPFVATFEGLETEAYLDIVEVPTICYGETKGVEMGDVASVEECDAMLEARLAEFEKGVSACTDNWDTLPTQTQAAFISFSYNVGIGAYCRSTLKRRVEAERFVDACNELLRWNKAGGRVVQGLVNRRALEREICLGGLETSQ